MGVMEIVMGIIVILVAVVLVGLVLLQSGKDKRLSGTIAGAAETFLPRARAKLATKYLRESQQSCHSYLLFS